MTGAAFADLADGRVGAGPYGVFEPPFNLVDLAIGAGAGFVAQGAVTTLQEHQDQLDELIAAGLDHKGFSSSTSSASAIPAGARATSAPRPSATASTSSSR